MVEIRGCTVWVTLTNLGIAFLLDLNAWRTYRQLNESAAMLEPPHGVHWSEYTGLIVFTSLLIAGVILQGIGSDRLAPIVNIGVYLLLFAWNLATWHPQPMLGREGGIAFTLICILGLMAIINTGLYYLILKRRFSSPGA